MLHSLLEPLGLAPHESWRLERNRGPPREPHHNLAHACTYAKEEVSQNTSHLKLVSLFLSLFVLLPRQHTKAQNSTEALLTPQQVQATLARCVGRPVQSHNILCASFLCAVCLQQVQSFILSQRVV